RSAPCIHASQTSPFGRQGVMGRNPTERCAVSTPTFLVELSRVLANPGNSQVARVAAGLQIKNSLTSKDPDIKAQYQQRWLAIDANARREVKNYVSPSFPFSSGFEPAELSWQWAQLPSWVASVGFLPCRSSSDCSPVPGERLRAVLCEHTHPHRARRCWVSLGFVCVVVAWEACRREPLPAGRWTWCFMAAESCAVCFLQAAEQGRPPEHTSKFYAKGALQYLVPILTQTLTKQDENDDDDDWNPCKAAGVCLMLLATCCEDDIVPHVLPFIKEHIKNPDWRYRDAAVMAFGCILEGPEPNQLKPLVIQAMPTLIELMKDPSVVVRDTAAWTVGRICEMLPEAAINDIYLAPLLQCLIEGLSAEPRVASNVCWAFTSLAEAAYEAADVADDQEEPATYCLSSSFELIVQKLLETTDRPDGHQNNLRSSAYEALMEIVKNSAKDCYPAVQKTTLVIMERLQQVLQMESHIQSTSDRIQFNDLQSLLCATLQNVLRKVQHQDALQISDVVMASLLRMFQSTAGSGGVQEDALMAVSTLVEVLGGEFLKYMDAFKPFLGIGLKNYAEYQVCLAAVGLVGDLCRALQSNILPFCDEVMQLLLENLGNENVHRSVKPQILSVFGDIALAIGGEFKKYLDVVLNTLQQASQAQVDKSDYDMVDYLNELREGCLEAYTGIIQGLKGDQENVHPDVMLVQPRVEFILSYIDHIAGDEDHTDVVVACSAGLIGDLCTAFGKDVLKLVEARPMIHELLTEGRRSKTNKTKTLATWATKELRKLKNQAW
uniref:Karyopherin subunit beta 1 n=1 Tax=Pavo cristatus TaxID=9049 RepID=A0A8C9EN56_PAVCR